GSTGGPGGRLPPTWPSRRPPRSRRRPGARTRRGPARYAARAPRRSRSRLLPLPRPVRAFAEEAHEGPDRHPGRPGGSQVVPVLRIRRAGDVQMDPRRVADELREEPGSGDRAAPSLADVLDVRDLGIDQLAVVGVEGQLPDRLARRGARADQLGGELIAR